MSTRTIQLDSYALTQLLDDLDASSCPVGAGTETRAEPQFRYRARSIRLNLSRAGGDAQSVAVHARSISTHNISVLAPCSGYLGSACEIYPIDAAGGWQAIPARIDASRQLDSYPDIWDLRIGLSRPVDVVRYAPSAWRARILVVDDSPTICRIMSRFLPDYHADATCIQDAEAALQQGLDTALDLIILDIEMPGMNGIEVARTLRERGCIPPIVIMTATSEAENRAACMAAGCDAFVSKPIRGEELSELIRMVKPPPLVSALDDDPDSHELVDEYVGQLRSTVDELTTAFRAGDRGRLTMLARQVRAEAPACGFPSLAKLATRVFESIEVGFKLSDVRRPLAELLRTARAARPARAFDRAPADTAGMPSYANPSA